MASSNVVGGASASSGAREPTDDEWAAMHSWDDIFAWARLKGTLDYTPSQRGSLLFALGADNDTSIEEFAAIPVENIFNCLENVWLYSESSDPDDGNIQDLIINPSEIVKGRAMSAHHVARIWSGVETTREYKVRRLDLVDAKSKAYRDAKLAA